jgi:hypothetical protein
MRCGIGDAEPLMIVLRRFAAEAVREDAVSVASSLPPRADVAQPAAA